MTVAPAGEGAQAAGGRRHRLSPASVVLVITGGEVLVLLALWLLVVVLGR